MHWIILDSYVIIVWCSPIQIILNNYWYCPTQIILHIIPRNLHLQYLSYFFQYQIDLNLNPNLPPLFVNN